MKRTLSQAQLEQEKNTMAPGAVDEGFMDHDGLQAPDSTTVTIVGAGPSGLMLA